jgi:hypothetical protein
MNINAPLLLINLHFDLLSAACSTLFGAYFSNKKSMSKTAVFNQPDARPDTFTYTSQ